jgi:CBS domain-containing protein
MKLKDIYRPDTVTIDVDDLAAAARRLELAQVGSLAVVDEAGKLVGIFTERDLVGATARAANPPMCWCRRTPRSDRRRPMSRRIPETSPVGWLELGVRYLPVTVGDDQLVGMGSMRDLPAVEAWM